MTDITFGMDPILGRIAGYLQQHPNRREIDPLDIGAVLLPHFYILEVLAQSAAARPRLHVRLVGTALDTAFGRSVRGHDLADFLHGARSSDVLDGFFKCATTRRAIWMRQVVHIGDSPPRYVEGVAVPIIPDLICGGLVFGKITVDSAQASFQSRPL